MTLSVLCSAVVLLVPAQCCSILIVLWPSQVFLNMSTSLFVRYTHWNSMIPASFNSCQNFCFTSMWHVLLPTLQLLPISTALPLSMLANIGNLTFSLNGFSVLFMNNASHTPITAAFSLASVGDKLTVSKWASKCYLCSTQVHHISCHASSYIQAFWIVRMCFYHNFKFLICTNSIPIAVWLKYYPLSGVVTQ